MYVIWWEHVRMLSEKYFKSFFIIPYFLNYMLLFRRKNIFSILFISVRFVFKFVLFLNVSDYIDLVVIAAGWFKGNMALPIPLLATKFLLTLQIAIVLKLLLHLLTICNGAWIKNVKSSNYNDVCSAVIGYCWILLCSRMQRSCMC